MALPDDPGPGVGGKPPDTAIYPAPLDLTVVPEGAPFLCRMGPGFEWKDGKLVVLYATPGGPVMWRVLEAEESRRLLEWMLKSAGVDGG